MVFTLRGAQDSTSTTFIHCATTKRSQTSHARPSSGPEAPGLEVNATLFIGEAMRRTQTPRWPQSFAADFLLGYRASLIGVTMLAALLTARRATFIVAGWPGAYSPRTRAHTA